MSEKRDATSFDGILDDYTPAEHELAPGDSDRDELDTRLNKAFDDSYEARLPYERDWELYRLYLKGEQLIVRHRDTGEIVRLTDEDSKRLRSVHNVLRPTSRSLVGKLTRNIPTVTVLPATSDFEEQHGSRAATALLEYIRRKEDLDLLYLDAMEYLPWGGNAIIHLTWNPKAGRRVAHCPVCDYMTYAMEELEQPCPQCSLQRQNELQQQQMQFTGMQAEAVQQAELSAQLMGERITPEDAQAVAQSVEQPPMQQLGPLPLDQEPGPLNEVYEGDIEARVRDLRNLFVEPGATSIKSANWVCLRMAIHVSEARRMFPEVDTIGPEDSIWADKTAELRFNSVDSYGDIEYLEDHCYVKEWHEKPTEEYPQGRVIYQVNDRTVKILEGEDNPYNVLGRFPFYHFTFDVNKGELWGEPFLAQAWHRQREINQLETQIREHVELALKPKLLNPMGSRISADEITAQTAQIIKYNRSAGDPSFLQWPPLSQQVFQRKAELVDDVRIQASVTEQEAGSSGADPSGRAMAIIESEAGQQVGPILMRCNAEWRKMHVGILQLFRARANRDRIWTIVGPDGLQTYSFDDLNLQDGYDVQIEQEDGLSRNPAIRLQQSLDLMNAGVFMDQMTGMPDIKAFMRHARLQLPHVGYEMEATERAAAAQIPYKVEQGESFMPQPEDDPMLFAEELLGWLRGPGRRAQVENPPLHAAVQGVWMFYAQWAMSGAPQTPLGQPMGGGAPPGMQQGPGAGLGGPDQSAMGGSANNPGHLPSDVMQEASSSIDQADQQGEAMAKSTAEREG